MSKVTITNGSTGSTVRTALNNMFTELYYFLVGKSGGQSVVGGTATTEGLTLTPNAADHTGSIAVDGTDDATTTTTGSLKTAGGLGVAKKAVVASLAVGTLAGVLKGTAGAITASATTADLPASTDKNYVTDLQQAAVALMIFGTPFQKTVTLTAAAAGTPVHIVTDAQVGSGKKVYVTKMLAYVSAATAWTDSTGTIVKVQDTAAVAAITIGKAILVGAAIVFETTAAGVTLGAAILTGVGLTTAKGIDIVADDDFTTGSDIIVTVTGFIK